MARFRGMARRGAACAALALWMRLAAEESDPRDVRRQGVGADHFGAARRRARCERAAPCARTRAGSPRRARGRRRSRPTERRAHGDVSPRGGRARRELGQRRAHRDARGGGARTSTSATTSARCRPGITTWSSRAPGISCCRRRASIVRSRSIACAAGSRRAQPSSLSPTASTAAITARKRGSCSARSSVPFRDGSGAERGIDGTHERDRTRRARQAGARRARLENAVAAVRARASHGARWHAH